MEEDGSQVELTLSSDMNDDGGVYHQPHISRYNRHNAKKTCFKISAALLIYAFGLLTGYLAHKNTGRSAQSIPNCDEPTSSDSTDQKDFIFDWTNLTGLLKNELTTSGIENSLSEFSMKSHQAGSIEDDTLCEKVYKRFKEYDMSPWTNEHFVKIQDPPASGRNKVTFRGTAFEEAGFLSYSGTGLVQGALLYAYYGEAADFRSLRELNISTSGRIVLVRAGKISFAEKVANAADVNASAVLIYPDPSDYPFDKETSLFGHVHLGTGDPYTPGFPSVNSTQFPPAKSSGLPSIPAQTIRASTAAAIMREMKGHDCPRGWGDGGLPDVAYKLGADDDIISVEVNNSLTEKRIHNVFGVIKGYVDGDRYVVMGAQRDAWGPGYAKSTVGTSLLVELARTISSITKRDGFKPRRSIVFASWSAGEYGAVGATEWLEGYLSSLNMKAFSYIGLDGVVTGSTFKASASPLMYDLIQSVLKGVSSPSDPSKSLYNLVAGSDWENAVMEPMRMDDAAYPFQAFSGIPSVSFHFTSGREYPFFGTVLDTKKNLDDRTSSKSLVLVKTAGEIAGQMALRLVHDHLLKLNVEKYVSIIRHNVVQINSAVTGLKKSGRLQQDLSVNWIIAAQGSFSRASRTLINTITDSDLSDYQKCRDINDLIMRVELNFLSPYVSPRESPFRHIILGSGSHTLEALISHLGAIKDGLSSADIDLLKNQLALATWTIQSCANALFGTVWDMDNEI